LISVKLFSVGHALELYLKAVYAKLTGDVKAAIGFGHDIPRLWKACKGLDQNFLPTRDIRQVVLSAMPLSEKYMLDPQHKADFEHYLKNQELYLAAKDLKNWKYAGLPAPKGGGPGSFGYVHPNPYWLEFFRELRTYLGHPSPNRIDVIESQFESRALPPETEEYLRGLYK